MLQIRTNYFNTSKKYNIQEYENNKNLAFKGLTKDFERKIYPSYAQKPYCTI